MKQTKDSMRVRLFTILLVVFVLHIQSGAAQTIELIRYDKAGCSSRGDGVKKQVAACTDIDEAERVLRKACGFTPGSMYKIYCRDCPPEKMMRRSPVVKEFPKQNGHNAHALAGKGDYKIFTLLQLRNMLTDSLALFDSLQLDISAMPPADKKRAQTLFFIREQDGKKCYPLYDEQKQVLLINRAAVLIPGQQLARINAAYLENGEEKKLPRSFYLFFISDEEKNALAGMAQDLKECDEHTIMETAVVDYLQYMIAGKYKKVDVDGLSRWINTIKL